MIKRAKRTKTVEAVLLSAMKRGATNAQAKDAVIRVHPHSKIGRSTVNWYRNQFRKTDKTIPSERDANRRA